jgi:uncharacterized membrane protein
VDARVHTAASESDIALTIKRNCSISPKNLLGVLCLLMCVSLGVASGFAYFGAWPILPFAGVEMAALAAAFYLNGRHAADYERIAVVGGQLLVEESDAGRLSRHEFSAQWLRLEKRWAGWELRVLLCSRGSELEIGRHLDTERRGLLAARLRRCLSNR